MSLSVAGLCHTCWQFSSSDGADLCPNHLLGGIFWGGGVVRVVVGSIRHVYEAEKNSPCAVMGAVSAIWRPSRSAPPDIWLPQDCVKLCPWVTVELAILLNLMIHYSSNGGPAPSGQRRYCIGSRVITWRLQYLLLTPLLSVYLFIYLGLKVYICV